ncbi:hypothetical protein HYALB_00013916 [Hymenoscyphus albidus]|uniref:Uncharacterized protein n=1 Tax=Hymenoscyphus albidus TaxID=595503 RepID=A0A9N9LV54_9HELO|nr:hypothetical protein HYALB_00013916 [Hymenoscyphus albidus]
MNNEMTETKDTASAEMLKRVKDTFAAMQKLMRPKFMDSAQFTLDAPHLFCDSTFLKRVQETDDFLARNEFTHRVGPRSDGGDDKRKEILEGDLITPYLSIAEVYRGALSLPNVHPYYSADMVRYRFDSDDISQNCKTRKAAGFSSVMIAKDKILVICTQNGWRGEDSLDTTKGVGTWLGDIEPKSLTFLHEIVHLVVDEGKSQDLSKQLPPPTVHLTNSDDTATEILLVALAQDKLLFGEPPIDGRKVDATFNPQNFAWAATAAYLAQNGAKLNYSTGRAEEITDGPPSGPALPDTPPTKE